MSALDSPHHHHHFDHHHLVSSKRKLDDSDHEFSGDVPTAFPGWPHRNRKVKSLIRPFRCLFPFQTCGQSSRCSGFHLQFFVRMISSGRTLVLHGNLRDTVEMVHWKIAAITGFPMYKQRLIYRGKELHCEQTLEDCSIRNDDVIELIGRIKSTQHPIAWRVLTDMVSLISRVCRNESLSYGVIKEMLEQYMTLPLDKPNKDGVDKKIGFNGKKEQVSDDDDEDDEDEEGFGFCPISMVDYCNIFLEACAPQALVMLYAATNKQNQDSADECIRSFVTFIKDLVGTTMEMACCATIVLEFCRLLRIVTGADDNLLYLHCRTSLGSILEKVDLNDYDTCIAVEDVFPFLKELGTKMVKDLTLSFESNGSTGPLNSDLCDFSAFLQPVAKVIHHKGSPEVEHLCSLYKDLLTSVDKCLNQMEEWLAIKRKKGVDVYRSGWSQYLAILKEISTLSVLNPESGDHFWDTMGRYKSVLCCLVVKYAKRTDDYSWLLKHKNILDYESRKHLAMLMFPELTEDYDELHEMLIDRSQLLSESFEYISRATPSSLHAGLFMQFKNEEATGPGVLREWFCLVCKEIFDPQNALFVACPLDRRRFSPNPASKVDPLHLRYFRFSGRVIALALMHKIQVGVVLDRVFFLQLAGRHVLMEDIRDADPCIYNSCNKILEMDAEFVDSDGLGLTFVTEVEELGSRKTLELCDEGKNIVVNSQNRKEYVNLIVQHHFVTSITDQISAFAEGFADILQDRKLRTKFFQSLEHEDFDWMLHGSESEISVEDWKAHTDYNGYKESDPQIVWFWEIVGELNADQKKTLLFFWTSVKYLPIEGFRGMASRLYIYKSLETLDRLPSSHTCFYRICIPRYPSKAVMQDRILLITQEHVGCSFGTW